MVGKPCQSRYVQVLWQTCVFYSHSRDLVSSVPSSWCHLDSLSLPRLLFSCECFMGHPTPSSILLRKELICSIHSLMGCQGGAPGHLLQTCPGPDELTPQSSGASNISVQNLGRCLGKRHFQSLSQPLGSELWGRVVQPSPHPPSTHQVTLMWVIVSCRKCSRKGCQSPQTTHTCISLGS